MNTNPSSKAERQEIKVRIAWKRKKEMSKDWQGVYILPLLI